MASVEYLIVDERQLNVFYTLGWDGENALEAQPALLAQDGEHLEGYAATWGSPGEELQEKDYRVATFYFAEGSLPDSALTCGTPAIPRRGRARRRARPLRRTGPGRRRPRRTARLRWSPLTFP